MDILKSPFWESGLGSSGENPFPPLLFPQQKKFGEIGIQAGEAKPTSVTLRGKKKKIKFLLKKSKKFENCGQTHKELYSLQLSRQDIQSCPAIHLLWQKKKLHVGR